MGNKAEIITPQTEPADQSIDQLREILFGAFQREYEQRLLKLEDKLISESKALKTFLEGQITQLEKETLASESKARKMAMEELTDRMHSGIERLGLQLETQQKEIQNEIMEVRDHLHETRQETLAAIEKNHHQLEDALQEKSDTLNKNKLDKNKLAEILSTLSEQVSKG